MTFENKFFWLFTRSMYRCMYHELKKKQAQQPKKTKNYYLLLVLVYAKNIY